MKRGVVVRDEGSTVVVDFDGEDAPVSCVVRKSVRRRAGPHAKAVVVGDRVEVEAGADGSAIVDVEPRRTVLSRPDPLRPRREHVIVANIDAVLVVASAREPDLATAALDRFLVAVECRHLEPAIAVTKVDLDPGGSRADALAVYRALGYPVFEVCVGGGGGAGGAGAGAGAGGPAGLDGVREFLGGRTTTMLGHSGVGKSSLANALDPSLQLRVGEVDAARGKGQHTTTAVSLLRLPWGGYLVDTPGVREFGLWGLESADVAVWYRDLARHVDACRFNDCLHEREPGCAVRAALERGEVAAWRYHSYLRLIESLRDSAAG